MKYFFLIFLFSSFICKAQTFELINQLEKTNQDCLDKGIDMLACSKNHYKILDSLMNSAYENLKRQVKDINRKDLDYTQKSWLKKRTKLFANAYLETKKEGFEEGRKDFEMAYIDKKSQIIITYLRLMVKSTK
ncbi:lysozyme inhibitor LprI family protein [Flavobacterium pallidum]|uniref:Lysozyme inhibitor LprI-like N-terminal domain-containing protein n=1 Tax=Flavobacterium pallidum TaxID=2172098 RepID=A0A2S1SK93_9FLAO|nr:lysozyme inhibitor LprI family protein [Flavobacterium pallidum]AWI26853.1 hypothetical protein HYN49_13610 [Flavobacterium pallidum]